MTDYALKQSANPLPSPAWQEKKEKRKHVLAAVRARRRELYHRMQNRRKAMKPGFLEG